MNQRIASIAYLGSVAAALLAAALMSGNAFAEGPIEPNPPFTSMRTRAEVQAEVTNDRSHVTSYESEWTLEQNASLPVASSITRAEARADYIAAREQVQVMNAEHGGSGYFGRIVPHPHATVLAGRGLH
jgi:hypothetical protein